MRQEREPEIDPSPVPISPSVLPPVLAAIGPRAVHDFVPIFARILRLVLRLVLLLLGVLLLLFAFFFRLLLGTRDQWDAQRHQPCHECPAI